MKILFYLYPALLSQGPHFNGAWSSLLLRVMRGVLRTGNCDCRMITADRFKDLLGADAEEMPIEYIDELSLHQSIMTHDSQLSIPTNLSRLVRESTEGAEPAAKWLVDEVTQVSAGFHPDVIITFAMQADYLKTIWPDAHIFYAEAGAFSRSPYPFTMFFDHQGMYHRSAAAQLRDNQVCVSDAALELAREVRLMATNALSAADPFQALDLRDQFERLVLLPLQVSNYFSFDDQAPYRTQFEFLLDVLLSAPKEIGIIVTEYNEWGKVLLSEGPGRNLDWLRQRFPNLIFMDAFREAVSPSQYLTARVDGLVTICSNLGYQALLLEKRLGCGYGSFLKNVAHDHNFQQFFSSLKQGALPDSRLSFLAWYIERYAVPETLFDNGKWFLDYLTRRIEAIKTAVTPEEGFVAIEPIDSLRQIWTRQLTGPVERSNKVQAEAKRQAPLHVGESVVVDASQAAAQNYLVDGFHTPELWGVWSNGKYAKLSVPVDLSVHKEVFVGITMAVRIFDGIKEKAPVLQLVVNGIEVGFVLFRTSSPGEQIVSFTRRIEDPFCDIEFNLSHAGVPLLVQSVEDRRELGFGLTSISVTVSAGQQEIDAGQSPLATRFWGLYEDGLIGVATNETQLVKVL